MSNSNTFSDNLNQTSLDDAYRYNTFSQYINNMKKPIYSPTCIFCSCQNTISLVNDSGSFRQCTNCKRQFKAIILDYK